MQKSMTIMALVSVAGGAATAAFAEVSQAELNRVQQIHACDAIARKSARYACYDRIERSPHAEAPAAAAPPARAAAAAPERPAQAAQADFGVESLPSERRARPAVAPTEQIFATAVAASDAGIGHWTVTLDSGARWRMIERDPAFVPPKPGQAVRIRRVALGSFLLFVGKHPGVRVQRIS